MDTAVDLDEVKLWPKIYGAFSETVGQMVKRLNGTIEEKGPFIIFTIPESRGRLIDPAYIDGYKDFIKELESKCGLRFEHVEYLDSERKLQITFLKQTGYFQMEAAKALQRRTNG